MRKGERMRKKERGREKETEYQNFQPVCSGIRKLDYKILPSKKLNHLIPKWYFLRSEKKADCRSLLFVQNRLSFGLDIIKYAF